MTIFLVEMIDRKAFFLKSPASIAYIRGIYTISVYIIGYFFLIIYFEVVCTKASYIKSACIKSFYAIYASTKDVCIRSTYITGLYTRSF